MRGQYLILRFLIEKKVGNDDESLGRTSGDGDIDVERDRAAEMKIKDEVRVTEETGDVFAVGKEGVRPTASA